jgi:hypothetical protein
VDKWIPKLVLQQKVEALFKAYSSGKIHETLCFLRIVGHAWIDSPLGYTNDEEMKKLLRQFGAKG